jgi:hypothetical protein
MRTSRCYRYPPWPSRLQHGNGTEESSDGSAGSNGLAIVTGIGGRGASSRLSLSNLEAVASADSRGSADRGRVDGSGSRGCRAGSPCRPRSTGAPSTRGPAGPVAGRALAAVPPRSPGSGSPCAAGTEGAEAGTAEGTAAARAPAAIAAAKAASETTEAGSASGEREGGAVLRSKRLPIRAVLGGE